VAYQQKRKEQEREERKKGKVEGKRRGKVGKEERERKVKCKRGYLPPPTDWEMDVTDGLLFASKIRFRAPPLCLRDMDSIA